MSRITFRTICSWGVWCFSWYVILFQLVSVFMEYKLIQMYDIINAFWNQYRDVEFGLVVFKLEWLVKTQALWLCFDTLYSFSSNLFQSTQKNKDAGSLTKIVLRKLVNVNLHTWNGFMKKHPTLIVETKALSRRAIDFIENVVQFLFAIVRMYISVYYSKNYIIVAYCALLASVSVFSLFAFRNTIEKDKLIFSDEIHKYEGEKQRLKPLFAEQVRQKKFKSVIQDLDKLVDHRVLAENASGNSQRNKTRFTRMTTRIIFCLVRWLFIMYFAGSDLTHIIHRQYILLTIGSHSANEIVNRMNNLINSILNAEKDCHRVLESLNLAANTTGNEFVSISPENPIERIGLRYYRNQIGTHETLVENIELNYGVTLLTGPNGSGKTVFLKSLAGYFNPEGLDLKNDVGVGDGRTLQGIDVLELAPQCIYVSDQADPFISTDWWLKHKETGLFEQLLDEEEVALFNERCMAEQYLDTRELSKGQAAKVSLLHALSSTTPVIFLDEVDACFDEKSQQRYVKLIENLDNSKGKLIICVSHAPWEASTIRKNMICSDGVIGKK
jgi:ABC-type cobalamin/Fe3+-siderophores transport system ATPase subunit